MQVRVRVNFQPPTETDGQAMWALARSLTEQPETILVTADTDPQWLVVDFTMPTEPQNKALPKIESALRYRAWNRWDSVFEFPLTAAERARADRRAARRRARRAEKRMRGPE
jgi:hypothetical protein